VASEYVQDGFGPRDYDYEVMLGADWDGRGGYSPLTNEDKALEDDDVNAAIRRNHEMQIGDIGLRPRGGDWATVPGDSGRWAARIAMPAPFSHHTVSTDGLRYPPRTAALGHDRPSGEDTAADLLVLAAKTQNGILADETIDRVRSEFRDWYEKKNPAYSPESAAQHWTNIENFFADHYPATHRGLTYGYENARPLLKQKNDAYWGDIPDADPYETGPEAVETHGYDPAEIAAAGLYLHNEGRWNRREFQNSDRNLLMKVIRERHKMEQARNSRPRQLMLPLDLP
jgi:hypothetical protein